MIQTYLTFLLYGEYYAIKVEKVLEVLEKQDLTEVPNAPEIIKGVLDFRGSVVPVYETGLVLKLAKLSEDSNYFIVVVELPASNGSCLVGAIVDRVKEVIPIGDDEIKSVPPMNKEYNSEAICGIARVKDEFIMIMDVDKIFAEKKVEK
jgi:purine-binding chemotaxis protein CheW